jgi:hypothetical protein
VVHGRGRKRSSSVPCGRDRSTLERERCGVSRDEAETFLGEDERRGMGQDWICCQLVRRENRSDHPAEFDPAISGPLYGMV